MMPSATPSPWIIPAQHHGLIAGASGRGKTGLVVLIAINALADPTLGLTVICPEGDIASALLEHIANPANGVGHRTVHYLQASCSTHAFSLPLLRVAAPTPQACHDVALRTRTVFEQVLNFGSGEYGPRLSKLFHLALFGLALAGRPLVHLPDLLTLGGAHLRQLADCYPYEFMSEEWRTLDVLAERNPTRFLEYTESLTSRLMPVFGNPRMRRIFGQDDGVDIARITARREVVILDLSGIEHKDSVLLGTAYSSLVYHHAIRQPPGRSPRMLWLFDEFSDYVTPDLARAFDRLRKRGVQIVVVLQRPSKLRDADDGKGSILTAVLTNTATKYLFGGLTPDDAEPIARQLFASHIDMAEWKPGTERPVAVGQRQVITRSRSHAEHAASHDASAVTASRGVGYARSRTHATMHAVTDATSSATSEAIGDATSTGASTGTAIGSFSGNTSSQGLSPTDTTLIGLPQLVSLGAAQSASTGSTDIATRSSASARSTLAATSSANMRAVTDAESIATGETVSESSASATTTGTGTSRGISTAQGESEAFVTDYAWLPTATYALAEQLQRLTGELSDLPPRVCYLKRDGERPVRLRTPDLPAAFRSASFKATRFPLWLAALRARSPYLRPAAEVDAEIAMRLKAMVAPNPEPDFAAPEPFPFRAPSPDTGPPPAPAPLPGRPPKGDLPPAAGCLRVIDGDKPADR